VVLKENYDKIRASKAKYAEKMSTLFTIEMQEMTKVHINCLVFQMFTEGIETMPVDCAKTKGHLRNLCMYFAMNELQENSGPLFETGYLVPGALDLMQQALNLVSLELRP
jgi:hypothetical protein